MRTLKRSLTAPVLEQIHKDYHALLKSETKLSIAELFNFNDFSITDYCRSYKSHAEADPLIEMVKALSEEYGVWLPNAKHHITCTLFLYPNATFDRMVTMMQNLTIDFYLNDVMGRDVFKHLSPQQQEHAQCLIERMGSVDEHLLPPPDLSRVENANIKVLQEFKDTAPADWFTRFVHLYAYHIGITHKDCNAAALGYIPAVEEYISLHCHYGGMHHIITWVEYGTGNFLNWTWLKTVGLMKELEWLHTAVAKFGALSNDLFSFEKEVIDSSTDANLLMVIALNNPEKSLIDVIEVAANTVRDFLKEAVTRMNIIRERCQHLYIKCSCPDLQRIPGNLSCCRFCSIFRNCAVLVLGKENNYESEKE